jgi:SAM-dependent methyltransferase
MDNSFAIRVARWPLLVRVLSGARILSGQSSEFAKIARQEDIRFANASRRIPYACNSVEVVYSSHMIEHLDRREAEAFLLEVKRVLRPGGIIRLAAPDLARLVREYLATGNADEFIYGTHMGIGASRSIFFRLKIVMIGLRHHLWMYDGRSLAKLLSDTGFIDVSVMPPGVTKIVSPGSLDLAERSDESVYVEAICPPD